MLGPADGPRTSLSPSIFAHQIGYPARRGSIEAVPIDAIKVSTDVSGGQARGVERDHHLNPALDRRRCPPGAVTGYNAALRTRATFSSTSPISVRTVLEQLTFRCAPSLPLDSVALVPRCSVISGSPAPSEDPPDQI